MVGNGPRDKDTVNAYLGTSLIGSLKIHGFDNGSYFPESYLECCCHVSLNTLVLSTFNCTFLDFDGIFSETFLPIFFLANGYFSMYLTGYCSGPAILPLVNVVFAPVTINWLWNSLVRKNQICTVCMLAHVHQLFPASWSLYSQSVPNQ